MKLTKHQIEELAKNKTTEYLKWIKENTLENKVKICSKAVEEKINENLVMYSCSYDNHYCYNPYDYKDCVYIYYHEGEKKVKCQKGINLLGKSSKN